jgi:SAM-dependent methyltransferase
MRLLDVGCGPGTITADLARRVSPGRAIGVDRAEEVIAQARTLADQAEEGLPAGLSFETADIYQLGFDDHSFDVVHAHQVLQHLDQPVAALREMSRVCRPGGYVAARDASYADMSWSPADPRLDRWRHIYLDTARANHGEPDAGRYLTDWARQAGLDQVSFSMSTWCYASAEERHWWGGLWADRTVSSAFADHAVERGFATRRDLLDIAEGWRQWSDLADGWFVIPHGEILCTL